MAEKCGCKLEQVEIGYPSRGHRILYCPLHEAAQAMLEALKDIFGMIETGELVRDIKNDGAPDWTMKMMRFVSRLQTGKQAIAKAERGK